MLLVPLSSHAHNPAALPRRCAVIRLEAPPVPLRPSAGLL